jgi:hypothetical protein
MAVWSAYADIWLTWTLCIFSIVILSRSDLETSGQPICTKRVPIQVPDAHLAEHLHFYKSRVID